MQFSIEQQILHTELALRLWKERVKPEDVVPGLTQWHCGTQACFGGHLVQWPEFQALGIREDLVKYDEAGPGSPCFPDEVHGCSYSAMWVARSFFGDDRIFYMRGEHPSDDEHEDLSGHALVVHRLETHLKGLRRKLAQEASS